MKDWRALKKGQTIIWEVNEFDGHCKTEAVITEVAEDHAIAEADGMHIWIDDDTQQDFH